MAKATGQPRLPFTEGPETKPQDAAPGLGHPFLVQMAVLCREEPARAKWLIVPRHGLGHALGDRLAREGVSWANLRIVTPLDLAVRMAAPFLIERGIDPSEEALGPARVMRLLAGVVTDGGYFAAMADQPSLADALWRTIRELRMAGLPSGSLAREAFPSEAKHRELAGVLLAYERWLDEQKVADAAAVIEAALDHPEYCPVLDDDVVIEWPDAGWEPVTRRFLDRLPGVRIVARAIDAPANPLPRRLGLLAARAERVAPAVRGGPSRLAWIRSPRRFGSPVSDGTLSVFHAGGREAEVAEILRRVVAGGFPLDHVEVACATFEHAHLVWEKAVGLGWKVTSGPGLPVATTRPARALLGWCDWVESEFSAARLRRWLLSGSIAPSDWSAQKTGSDPVFDPVFESLTPARAARVLAQAEVTWGRATYGVTLESFARYQLRRAREDDDPVAADRRRARASQARTLASWVDARTKAVPVADAAGTMALGPLVAAARAMLETEAAIASEIDAAARAALDASLAMLAPLDEYRCPLATALRFVRERTGDARVGRDRARPGHLHVSALEEAGADGRPVVFVAGLEEGAVFPSPLEDPILLDEERSALARYDAAAGALESSRDRVDEAVFTIVSRLADIGACAERVTLSFSCRDTRQFRESFASWVVLHAHRLIADDPTLIYRDLRRALGTPVSVVPSSARTAATSSEWWLAQARHAAGAAPAVESAFPALAAGRRAEDARAGPQLTAFDGWVPDAAGALDPTRHGRPVSVTTLEALATCPFRYFLEHGLRVSVPEEMVPDPDVWLDARSRGSVLHDLYAALMRRARDGQRRVTLRQDREWLHARARERLVEFAGTQPPASQGLFDRELTALCEDLDRFLDREIESREFDPVGLEVSFGYPDPGSGESLADPEPLAIDLGARGSFLLRGRIDRIDRLVSRPHEYRIVDYKTGAFSRDRYTGTFAGGQRLQPVLYARAARRALRRSDRWAVVTEGAYRFPTGRGFGGEHRIPVPPDPEVDAVVTDVLDVVAAGTFTHACEKPACRWCTLRAACGEDPWGRAASKLESDQTALVALRRLRERE
jgi:ATP-dependent helicase/nuclease subunit B